MTVSSVSGGNTGTGRLVQAARTQDKPAALRWCRCGRMPAKKKIFSAGLPVWAAPVPAAGGTPPGRWFVVAARVAATAKSVRRHAPASCGPRQVRVRFCGLLTAARALMCFGSVLCYFQVVMAAVPGCRVSTEAVAYLHNVPSALLASNTNTNYQPIGRWKVVFVCMVCYEP